MQRNLLGKSAKLLGALFLGSLILLDAGHIVQADHNTPDDPDAYPDGTWVSVPSTTAGTIEERSSGIDRDFFRIDGRAGVTYRARVLLGTLSQGFDRVYSANGQEVASSSDGDASWTASSDQTYYIEVWGGSATGTYDLSLESTGGGGGDCVSELSLDRSVSDTWSSDCRSANRSDSYARFYTFSVGSATNVRIDLESDTDPYLFLLSGSGTSGSTIESDDDGGTGNNSQIFRRLPQGTYTIEATTYRGGDTGSFTLSLNREPGGGGECVESIVVGQSVGGPWSSDCRSVNRRGSYAVFYTFSVDSGSNVRIDLDSGTDNYLYLLDGSGTSGRIIESDDDGGPGRDSQIIMNLARGTYTLEATTYDPGIAGSFSLSLVGGPDTGGDCEDSIIPGRSVGGSWSGDCRSVNRSGRYARFYTFSVDSTSTVRIDLDSATDAYLILLEGSGTSGRIIESDDDGGPGRDSQIIRDLAGGTYTLEATTYGASETGSFTLSLSGNDSDPFISIESPTGGEALQLGQSVRITWSSSGIEDVQSQLSWNDGDFFSIVNFPDSVDATRGYYDWVVPENNPAVVSDLARIKAIDIRGSGINDVSDRFSIRGSGGGECVQSAAVGRSTSGSWASSCQSVNRNGRYANFYTFFVNSTSLIQIDLESSQDTYLYLLNGAGTSGTVVESDDDDGSDRNSLIVASLSPGTYTAEATTYGSAQTGNFTLSLSEITIGADCTRSIPIGWPVTGSWSSECVSANRGGRYARYYTFSIDSTTNVQIDLESGTDAYLYLLDGSGPLGSVIESDDDDGPGGDSMISRTLSRGTYTVEATTYSSARTGGFELTIQGPDSGTSEEPIFCQQYSGGGSSESRSRSVCVFGPTALTPGSPHEIEVYFGNDFESDGSLVMKTTDGSLMQALVHLAVPEDRAWVDYRNIRVEWLDSWAHSNIPGGTVTRSDYDQYFEDYLPTTSHEELVEYSEAIGQLVPGASPGAPLGDTMSSILDVAVSSQDDAIGLIRQLDQNEYDSVVVGWQDIHNLLSLQPGTAVKITIPVRLTSQLLPGENIYIYTKMHTGYYELVNWLGGVDDLDFNASTILYSP